MFKQIYTTNLTSIDDKNVGHTPTPVSCKTINETINETINTSKESELNKDSLSEVERVNNKVDTKVESEVVKDTDKESVTHERLLELIPVLREKK